MGPSAGVTELGAPCWGWGDIPPPREGMLSLLRGRRLGQRECAGRNHNWICVATEFEADESRDGAGEGGKAGRTHAMEAFEWLFKKRGLHPVGFEQIFVDHSIMTDTLCSKIES